MAYTAAQVAAIRARAVEIGTRGVLTVKVGDREHRFTDPMKLEEFALMMESQMEDDDHAGQIDVIFAEPE